MEVKADEVTEDYRSDRLLLEELVAEVRRLHRRLDEYEPHARRMIDNPIARMLHSHVTKVGGMPWRSSDG